MMLARFFATAGGLCLAFGTAALGMAQERGLGGAEIRLGISEEGRRAIGETEKNLLFDVLGSMTIHARMEEPVSAVLYVVRFSGGKAVARGETAPFQLDPQAASSSRGVLLSRLLHNDQLRGVAPLRPAEFLVTSYTLATVW
jgi:hypothetical protein